MSLLSAFKKFSNDRSTMEVKIFVGALSDAGVFNGRVAPNHAEYIFDKVKNSANIRGINYQQFETCLAQIATQGGMTRQQIEGMLIESSKKVSAKKGDPSRFFYDKSTYTGVHTKGGPTNIDHNGYSHLSQLCDRTSANVRGVKY